MHRGRDVLHFLRADVGELHRQLVGDLFVHRARHADAADFGQPLETRGDVDAVAQQVAVALDHVADGDADAKAHLPARRIRHVPGTQAFLDIDRAAHGFDRAWKFREDGVAGGIEDAAAAFGDEIVGHLPVGRQPPQRFLFVLGNQSAVAGNIGRKNRRDLAFHESQPRTTSAAAECRQKFPGATCFRTRSARQARSSGQMNKNARHIVTSADFVQGLQCAPERRPGA